MNLRTVVSVSAIAVALLVTSACAESTPTESETNPSAELLSSVTGTWGTPDTVGEPHLIFEEDGSVHGSDGCNALKGTYTSSSPDIEFGPITSTRKFCEGVDDWLSHTTSATLEGNTLTFANTTGEVIGTLERVA